MEDQDLFAFNPGEGKNEGSSTDDGNDTAFAREMDSVTVQDKAASNSESQSLSDWMVTLDGVSHAMVLNHDGTCRAFSAGTPEEIQGLFGLVLLKSDGITRALSLPASFSYEITDETNRKLIALKLKSGFLCVVGDEHLEISVLINQAKSRPNKEGA